MNSAVTLAKQKLGIATIKAFMPIILKSLNELKVKNFDEKLQRSYFLLSKKK